MPLKRIVDEIEFNTREDAEKREFLKTELVKEDAESVDVVSDPGVDELDIVLQTDKNRDSVVEAKAKKFIDLVRKGATPGEAALKVGMSVAQIKRSRIRKRIEDLTLAYHLPDEIRKILVKAGLNRLYMMNLGKKDPANQKILLDTIKQMAGDPDVGLQSNQQVGVQINLGEIAELLTRVTPDITIEDNKI